MPHTNTVWQNVKFLNVKPVGASHNFNKLTVRTNSFWHFIPCNISVKEGINIMEKRNNNVHENKYTRTRKYKINISGVRGVFPA